MDHYYVDEMGNRFGQDPAGMAHPALCRHCNHLHDAGKARTVQRYTDCSVWRCPSCKTLIDDRPYAWGGSLTGQDVRERYEI